MFSQISQDIVCLFQFYTHLFLMLLYLVLIDIGRTIVSDCCCFNDNVLLKAYRSNCIKHFLCRHYRNKLYKRWRFDCTWSADQCYIRPTEHSCFCQCISHLSGRMIRNIAYRIDCLLCRSGSHKDFTAKEIFFFCNFSQDIVQKHLRFRHLSGSCIATCQITTGRLDHFITIMLQNSEIILNDRVFVHICIHSR